MIKRFEEYYCDWCEKHFFILRNEEDPDCCPFCKSNDYVKFTHTLELKIIERKPIQKGDAK